LDWSSILNFGLFFQVFLDFFEFIDDDFDLLEVDSQRCGIKLLFLQFLVEKRREIVKSFILFVPILSFHESMIFGKHVHSDSLTSCKIFCAFVLTKDAHHADFDFFLQIKNQFGFIDTIILLRNEKGVISGHVGE
jgi:hypothetical protein